MVQEVNDKVEEYFALVEQNVKVVLQQPMHHTHEPYDNGERKGCALGGLLTIQTQLQPITCENLQVGREQLDERGAHAVFEQESKVWVLVE